MCQEFKLGEFWWKNWKGGPAGGTEWLRGVVNRVEADATKGEDPFNHLAQSWQFHSGLQQRHKC